MPIGSENGLKGIIDIVNMQSVYYEGDSGLNVRRDDKIPDEYIEEVKETRELLISRLAELDEEIEELYLMEEDISVELIDKVIRRTTLERTFCPVFMGSAYKNVGIQ